MLVQPGQLSGCTCAARRSVDLRIMRLAEYQLVLQSELGLRAVCLIVFCKLIFAVVLDEVYACDVELRMLDRNSFVDLLQSKA